MKSSQAPVLSKGFSLLEGPRWFNNQLFVSDFFSHRVLRFDSPISDRYETLCVVDGQPSGLALAKDGSLRIVSMLDRKLLKWNGAELSEVADLSFYFGSEANDMAMDDQGRCYIGSFGLENSQSTFLKATQLLRVDTDGLVTPVADDLIFPNGIVFSSDGKTLFVAETYRGRITAFSVLENGDLGERRIWAQFGTLPTDLEIRSATNHLPILPDGLALDAEGALWIADAKGNGIARVIEGGETVEYISTGDLSVYASALGGPNMTTLYLCCAPAVETFDPRTSLKSVLMSCEVSVPGLVHG